MRACAIGVGDETGAFLPFLRDLYPGAYYVINGFMHVYDRPPA